MKLKDKVAIITGASSGIGEATARLLAKEGAKVVLAARRTDRLESLKNDIESNGGTAIAVKTDVVNRSEVENLATATLEKFGRIDILVNNAGIMPLSFTKNLHVDEWDRMVDVNIKGVLYATAAVLPAMREQKDGHILNISSVAGRKLFPGGTVYCATKFAVNALTEGMRMELSPPDNIRFTSIEPGATATELTNTITDQEIWDMWNNPNRAQMTPLQSEDIAEAVLYAVTQPGRVSVNEILLQPTDQGM